MFGILEKARGLAAKADTSSAAAYREMVKAIAAGGKEPAPAAVVETLEAAGKSFDDAEQDVAKQRRRLDLIAKLATRPAVVSEQEKINASFRSVREKYEAAQEEFSRASAPLYARTTELTGAIAGIDAARNELVDKLPDPDLATELDQVRFEVTEAANRATRLEHAILDLERGIASDMAAAYPGGERIDPEEVTVADVGKLKHHSTVWLEQARAKKRQLVDARGAVPALRETEQTALRRVAELEARALQP